MGFIFIILLLSVPVFYLTGLITFVSYFVKMFSGKKNTSSGLSNSIRSKQLRNVIFDLQSRLTEKNKSILQPIIDEYRKQLRTDSDVVLPSVTVEQSERPQPSVRSTHTHSAKIISSDISQIPVNLESLHSINALLYIGAFLIVAAAGIFVGFQWETIPGITKALLLTTVSAAFFAFGYWFYSLPKVRSAGGTFFAIGAILIPVCGVGWYNFYFQSLGVSYGSIWLFTSLIGIMVYLLLTRLLQMQFYTYILSLSVVSASMSLVNMFSLDTSFYVLAGIVSSLLLLVVRIFYAKPLERNEEVYAQPIYMTAQCVLPIVLVYGLLIAGQENILFSFSATISLFFAAVFYALTYYYLQTEWALPLSLVFVAAGVYVGAQWQMLPMITTYYLISILSLLEVGLVYSWQSTKQIAAAQSTVIISCVQFVIVFLAAYAGSSNVIDLLILSFLGIILGASYVYAIKNTYFYLFSGLFSMIFLFIFCQQYLHLTDTPYILGLVYTIAGILSYGAAVTYKRQQEALQTGLILTGVHFFLGITVSISFPGFVAFILFIFASLAYSASWYLRRSEAIYLSNIALSAGLGELLYYFQAASWIYPLVYAGLYFVLYFISTIVRTHNQPYYYRSALTGSILVPLVYSWSGSWSFQTDPHLEMTSLIAAYGATILYSLHSVSQRSLRFGYAASAIGMYTYLWQIHYLDISNIQFYTAPFALYMFAIAYTRRLKDDEQSRLVFDLLGLLILFIPTLSQSFSETNGIFYTFLMLIEGCAIVFIGNSLRYKPLLYGGTAAIVVAVIAKTYQYLILLPWWMVVGIIGIIFLSTAIYLLWKRNK